MPGKWGGAPPLDPPMKYHQKLGCQANGGCAPGAPPLDPPMLLEHDSKVSVLQAAGISKVDKA